MKLSLSTPSLALSLAPVEPRLSIPNLQVQLKWRNPSNTVGMACDLESNLPLVKSDINIIIQENYRAFPDLASLAKDMQLHAIDFIQDFIR